MLKNTLITLYDRDLNNLKKELEQYTDEKTIWKVKEGISNSAGNLTLHLLGNLNHFVGSVLGATGYVRQRDSEFTTKDIARKELLSEIDKLNTIIKDTLGKITDADLNKEFPIELLGKKQTIHYVLVHLLGHFEYHLGQINYHRRLIG
jgi:hypothetical protein